MSTENIPKHGKPDRLYTLCSLLTESPQGFSKIAETLETSEKTVRRDVRLGLALGLLEQTENGVKITELGDVLGKKEKQSVEYHQYVRKAISQYSPYRTLTAEIFPSAQESVQREDVKKYLSLTLGLDLNDDNMKHVASTYLRTISASGVGPYKQSSGKNPARVEIEDEDALGDLLSVVNDPGSGFDSSSDAKKEGVQQSAEESPEEQFTESRSGPVDEIEVSTREARPNIHFEICLNLNGEEDPEVVEDLVRGIRRSLGVQESEPAQQKEADSNHNNSDVEISVSKNPSEGELNEDEPTEDGSPDSSLGDFE